MTSISMVRSTVDTASSGDGEGGHTVTLTREVLTLQITKHSIMRDGGR